MQEHLYLGKSHCWLVLNNPSRHLLKGSRELVPRRERTALHETGTLPWLDGSHCEFPVRELPLGTKNHSCPKQDSCCVQVTPFSHVRFSWVLSMPTDYRPSLHFLPEKKNKSDWIGGCRSLFCKTELFLRTNCPASVIILSQDTRSVHGIFLLLLCLISMLAEARNCAFPIYLNPMMQNSTDTLQQASARVEFSEGKNNCTLNK